MSRKTSRPTGFSNVTCDKCGATAHALSGTRHRRCGPKPKRGPRLPQDQRGKWS